MIVKNGLVFGVFDHLHPGHEYFLKAAKSRCKELTVVVTLPEIVEQLKKKVPSRTLEERMNAIKHFNASLNVVAGDAVLGEWNVFKPNKPDMVFLGYDQQGIAMELDKLGMKYEYINAYLPEKYKTSLLRPYTLK